MNFSWYQNRPYDEQFQSDQSIIKLFGYMYGMSFQVSIFFPALLYSSIIIEKNDKKKNIYSTKLFNDMMFELSYDSHTSKYDIYVIL